MRILFFNLLHRLRVIEPGAININVSLFDSRSQLRRKFLPAHTDKIDGAHLQRTAVAGGEGRYVYPGAGTTGEHGHATDAYMLVKNGLSGHYNVIAYLAMTGESGIVSQNNALADPAIMRNMGVVHEEAVITDGGEAITGATMNGGVFTNGDPVTDDYTGRLVFVAQVLGFQSNRSAREYAAVLTNLGATVDNRVTTDTSAGPYFNMGTNNCIRSNVGSLMNYGATVDNGRGMDQGFYWHKFCPRGNGIIRV